MRYPHLVVRPLRGNLDTRLSKLDRGDYAAIILAAAGLKRLGLGERIRALLDPEDSLPAAGQGALGIEIRADRADLAAWLAPLHHEHTAAAVEAERMVSRSLGGSCEVPLAAYASWHDGALHLRGFVATIDGQRVLSAQASAPRPPSNVRLRSTWKWRTRSNRKARWISFAVQHRQRSRAPGVHRPPATDGGRPPGNTASSVSTCGVHGRDYTSGGSVDALLGQLDAAGFATLDFPLIDIAPVADDAPLRAALGDRSHAMRWSYSCRPMRSITRSPAAMRLAARAAIGVVGPGSVQALARHGVAAPAYQVISPASGPEDESARFDSEGLFAAIERISRRGESRRQACIDRARRRRPRMACRPSA